MELRSRRSFLKGALQVALGAAALGAGGLLYARAVEPEWIEVSSVAVTLPRLPRSFRGYRLVQVSDIHVDRWMTRDRLAGVVGLVNEQRADLVALTGDYVTHGYRRRAADLASGLGALRGRDGVVAVLGNHDHWLDARFARDVLRDSGVIELSNSAHAVRRGEDILHVAGVDDYWTGHARLEAVLGQLPPDGAAILLAHEPDFADLSARTGRFDLQISGHSHGGQVRLPLVGAPVLPPFGQKYPLGLYRVGDMLQYTNRGVGMLAPHIRLNCRPEITVFTLEAG
jgi:predicted MPP superfamily phosphohydrolase